MTTLLPTQLRAKPMGWVEQAKPIEPFDASRWVSREPNPSSDVTASRYQPQPPQRGRTGA
ncbi:hypothetical protein BJ123_103208 [Rhodopseudomonas thermotolerans]|uniref:Uncharacterized protein n=1 Tax=Rhodopseudomonas thermotolerans TaxID=999700 RepID=A0ABX9JI77_9BRAD|nr:hypothetical protein BJ123_103208 [Rhodopseudomonas thermotolerans]